MHMVGVADHFDINLVVAPDGAGVTSALGMLATDLAFERSVTFVAPLLTVEPAELARRFAQLIATGVRQMGFDAVPSELVVERLADIRYRGQAHSLTVPVPEGPIDDRVVAALAPAYRAQFHQEFGVDRDAPAEVSAVRVRLRIPVAGIADPVVGRHGTGAARTGTRPAYFGPASGKAYVDTAVYQRDRLVPGDELSGPAIVEGAVDTVVVPPGWTAAVDERRGLRLVRTRA
jgi:N-methylhydantoinase A